LKTRNIFINSKSPLLVNLVNFKSDNNDILIFDSEDIKINNDDYKDTKTK